MAFCYKNRGRFVWSKYVGSRRPVSEHHPRSDKGGMCAARSDYDSNSFSLPPSLPPSLSPSLPLLFPLPLPSLPPLSATNKETREPMASGANNLFSKAEDYERNNSEMNPHSNATAIIHIHPITNEIRSELSCHDKSTGLPSPPPYTPTKPTPLPSNGAIGMTSSEKEVKDTPTHVTHSTPEHKLNKAPPSQLTLTLPPKPTTPPTQPHYVTKAPPSQLALSTPHKTTPPTQSQFTPSQASLPPSHAQFQPHKHPAYRRASSHSYSMPPTGQFSTLPTKKRHSSLSHSETTPPKRPSSAEAPPTGTFPRPSASAYNLSSAANSTPRAQHVAMATPPKQRVPHSPFSASSHFALAGRGGVPSSPHSGTSSVGTPASTCSTSSPHFRFPTPKTPAEGGGMAYYRRGDRARSNPNMKATGVAMEPTTNQEIQLYGNNVAPQSHTIDRKTKLPKGYTRQVRSPMVMTPLSPPHPDTRVIEVDGSFVGCTDC